MSRFKAVSYVYNWRKVEKNSWKWLTDVQFGKSSTEEFVISSNRLKSARDAAACSSLVSSATTILSNVVSLISALIFSAIVIVSFVNTFPDDGMTGTWNVKSLFEMDYFFTLISSPNVLPRKIQNTHSFFFKKKCATWMSL